MDQSRLERLIEYRFAESEHLTLALTHRSRGRGNNERLEFLGDSLIGFVVADLLYEAFPEAPEGVLSRLRASLVNQGALASFARRLKLGDHLLLGPGELKSGGFNRDSILCDAYESLIGSIYLDGGYDAARQFIAHQFAGRISELDPNQDQKDPKTRLQETLLGRARPVPSYEVVAVEGPPHDRRFTVHCHVNELEASPFEGRGRSRREAEQEAAALAQVKLNASLGVTS